MFVLLLSISCLGQVESQVRGDSSSHSLVYNSELTMDIGYEFFWNDDRIKRGLHVGVTVCPKNYRFRGKIGFLVNNWELLDLVQLFDVGYTTYYDDFSWTPYIGIANLSPVWDDSRESRQFLALGVDFDVLRRARFSIRPGIRFDFGSALGVSIGAQLRFGTLSKKE